MHSRLSSLGPHFRREESNDSLHRFGSTRSTDIDHYGYVCNPQNHRLLLKIFNFLSVLLLATVDISASLIRVFFNSRSEKRRPCARSIGERSAFSRMSSLRRLESVNVLETWLKSLPKETNVSYIYESYWEALKYVCICAAFDAHAKRCAAIILNDKNRRRTNSILTKSIAVVKNAAKRSTKFRFLYKNVIKFLDDIEKSTAESMIDFMEALATNMLEKGHTWYMNFMHGRCRSKTTQKSTYETTMAVFSLFYDQGAGLESYILKSRWRNPKNSHDAGMTLLMYCALQCCISTSCSGINLTEFSGLERILMTKESHPFRKQFFISLSLSDPLFTDKMMLEVSFNRCNDMVESSWSNETLERAAWALSIGNKYMSKDVFEQLQNSKHYRSIDLSNFHAVCLLAFSVCGLIHFKGRHDDVYRATGDSSAALQLRGILPIPIVKDLVSLGLVERTKRRLYVVKSLPGCSKTYNGIQVEDRIILMESKHSIAFSASLSQQVG